MGDEAAAIIELTLNLLTETRKGVGPPKKTGGGVPGGPEYLSDSII